jgi:hypothetical protein
MPLKVHAFAKHSDMDLHLRGGIKVGPPPTRIRNLVFGLHNLTLVFIQPAALTVTFSDASNAGLSLTAILAAIKAAVAALDPKFKDGCLELVEATPTNGVSLNLQTSTALTVFGWSGEQDPGSTHTNVVYNPPDGAAPRYLDWTGTNQGEGYLLLTEEP